MLVISKILALAATVSAVVASSVSIGGSTVEVGGVPYYIPGGSKGVLSLTFVPSSWDGEGYIALTILPNSPSGYSSSVLANQTAEFKGKDDVWCEGFLDAVLYTTSTSANSTVYAIVSEGTERLRSRSASPSASGITLPNGPYFGSLNSATKKLSIFEAFRLYPDDAQAFHYGLLPTTKGKFTAVSASLVDHNGVAAIAVPSKLYYTPTSAQPLAGLRFAVKDLYDVAGVKTSMGNRAWLSLYPVVNETAYSIQRLLDLGAVLVGKTRLSQFANGEYGTADNVDYLTPFNARGDGYQDPSSSSSGAGAIAGNYEWIDFSVGSDTGGSIRAPAGVEGVYGNRPTQDAISLTGVLSLSPAMDTAAFVARDPKIYAKVAKAWYGGNKTLTVFPTGTPYPKTLLYVINPSAEVLLNQSSPGFFPSSINASQPIYDAFISKLEAHIGVNKTEYDFYAANYAKFGMYPADYVGTVWTLFIAYDQWNEVGKKFYADYAAVHNGDVPFVDEPIRFDWQYGANITAANKTFWAERKESWKHWVTTEVLAPNAETCSESLWLHPIVMGGASYKSDYHDATTSPYNGWNRYGVSQLGGVPEVVLTIGQIPYVSKLTNTTKYLPVAISILAAEGCDFILYDLIDSLADAGVISKTQVGPLTYALE